MDDPSPPADQPPPPAPPAEGVSVILPVREPAAVAGPAVRGWLDYLATLDRPWELLVVDDGGPPDVAADLAEAAAGRGTVLRHDAPRGYGACVRTALSVARHPLVMLAAADYPYTPADLGGFLERVGRREVIYDREYEVVVVAGCRTGRRAPLGWRLVGRAVRGFAHVALGLPLEPSPGWLGAGEHVRSWVASLLFGCNLHDPNGGFKLFRRSLLDRFPVQCDGDMVHVELIAKATFLTSLVDEVPLTPSPAPIPRPRWTEFRMLLGGARFHRPPLPPKEPDEPPGVREALPADGPV